jgi:hypothetical protein
MLAAHSACACGPERLPVPDVPIQLPCVAIDTTRNPAATVAVPRALRRMRPTAARPPVAHSRPAIAACGCDTAPCAVTVIAGPRAPCCRWNWPGSSAAHARSRSADYPPPPSPSSPAARSAHPPKSTARRAVNTNTERFAAWEAGAAWAAPWGLDPSSLQRRAQHLSAGAGQTLSWVGWLTPLQWGVTKGGRAGMQPGGRGGRACPRAVAQPARRRAAAAGSAGAGRPAAAPLCRCVRCLLQFRHPGRRSPLARAPGCRQLRLAAGRPRGAGGALVCVGGGRARGARRQAPGCRLHRICQQQDVKRHLEGDRLARRRHSRRSAGPAPPLPHPLWLRRWRAEVLQAGRRPARLCRGARILWSRQAPVKGHPGRRLPLRRAAPRLAS